MDLENRDDYDPLFMVSAGLGYDHRDDYDPLFMVSAMGRLRPAVHGQCHG